MVQINFARREVNCKLVYYGPGLSGKTTNIEKVHELMPAASRGQLTSIATEGDRTLFFDFLPLDLGDVAGMQTKFQIYTVPGQVYYNGTRKLVLQGADGVVFVADSNPEKRAENAESLKNLEENLAENGVDISTIPLVLQYNKRDLPTVMTIEEMNQDLNRFNAPTTEAVAYKGDGVLPTLKVISKLVLQNLNKEYSGGGKSPSAKVKPVSAATPAAKPAAMPAAASAAASGPVAPAAAGVAVKTPAAPIAAKAPVASAPPVAAKAPSGAAAQASPARPASPAGPAVDSSAPPKFVPKAASKPVRAATAPVAAAHAASSPEPARKSGMLWVFVALGIVAAAGAVYFFVIR